MSRWPFAFLTGVASGGKRWSRQRRCSPPACGNIGDNPMEGPMQVTYRKERKCRSPNPDFSHHDHETGPAFCVNPRGILTHRIRSARTHLRCGKATHITCNYWCGNIGKGEFVEVPPKGRLLCTYCEAKAVAAGEKPADKIAGRHVH